MHSLLSGNRNTSSSTSSLILILLLSFLLLTSTRAHADSINLKQHGATSVVSAPLQRIASRLETRGVIDDSSSRESSAFYQLFSSFKHPSFILSTDAISTDVRDAEDVHERQGSSSTSEEERQTQKQTQQQQQSQPSLLSLEDSLCTLGCRQSPIDICLCSDEEEEGVEAALERSKKGAEAKDPIADSASSSCARIDPSLPPIRFDYTPINLTLSHQLHRSGRMSCSVNTIVHTGETLQMNVDSSPQSAILIGPDRYSLVQFHFHSPSEHTINSYRYDMEIHFVHHRRDKKDAVNRLGVIGVWLRLPYEVSDAGSELIDRLLRLHDEPSRVSSHDRELLKLGENAFLSQLNWSNLPERKGSRRDLLDNAQLNAFSSTSTSTSSSSQTAVPQLLDLRTVFPPFSHSYFTYSGSLTTPPCNETVDWFVLDQVSTLSLEQLAQFRHVIGRNARTIQPLNGRVVRRFQSRGGRKKSMGDTALGQA